MRPSLLVAAVDTLDSLLLCKLLNVTVGEKLPMMIMPPTLRVIVLLRIVAFAPAVTSQEFGPFTIPQLLS